MTRSALQPSTFAIVLGCMAVLGCAGGSEGSVGGLSKALPSTSTSGSGSGGSNSTSGSGGGSSVDPSGSGGGIAVDPSGSGGGSSVDPTAPTGDDASTDADPGLASDDGGTTVAPAPSLGSLFPPPAPPTMTSPSDAMSCANLGCFDVFDCAIFHPAEFGPCGFTQCVGLICK
jgi:hypothetical protein